MGLKEGELELIGEGFEDGVPVKWYEDRHGKRWTAYNIEDWWAKFPASDSRSLDATDIHLVDKPDRYLSRRKPR